MKRVVQKVHAGLSLNMALKEMELRVDMPEVHSLVSHVNQSSFMGPGILEGTVEKQAKKMRNLQLLSLEMKKERASLILTFL